jgi:HTH-type transcriptional repressor of NAD biosynthesis genes
MFNVGFIVGKFSPLHTGHEFLINTAKSLCKKLVILSYSNPEFFKNEWFEREYNLKTTFPDLDITVIPGYLTPDNNASEFEHRNFCSKWFYNNYNCFPDVIFTSENYGNGFAEFMSDYANKKIQHVLVDLQRFNYPISGTNCRNNFKQSKSFLNEKVKANQLPRFLILGGESSGKTTLCKEYSEKYSIPWVKEFGRDFYEEKNGHLEFDDMLHIGLTQLNLERSIANTNKDYVICDTGAITTKWYSMNMFDKVDCKLDQLSKRSYDGYILCDTNIPFDQDGTRIDSEFRNKGHNFYLNWFKENNLDFIIVKGTVKERILQMNEYINNKIYN